MTLETEESTHNFITIVALNSNILPIKGSTMNFNINRSSTSSHNSASRINTQVLNLSNVCSQAKALAWLRGKWNRCDSVKISII
uniref:Uncharacterized protein n=1 Tax=Rhizophora mucronata TaxID=61149 RepID=A0A2P2NJD5_RHIMU